jgi:2,3-bisphosphoglycerate-independent phosphoglycerate mutase
MILYCFYWLLAMKSPSALIILDGFGYRKTIAHNAIAHAHMPNYTTWLQHYPHTLLHASGTYVGLPDHTAGNSLVGHSTIGSGRVILQPTTLLLNEIRTGEFFKNKDLSEKLNQLKKSGNSLHLMGLLSDTGNHSHEDVLYALLRMAHDHGINNITIHVFLDGRDVSPRSASTYLNRLDNAIKNIPGTRIGTMQGRSFPMDRTNNQGTISRAFDILTQPHKPQFTDWKDALNYYYNHNIADEFIPPIALFNNSNIKDGDGLIFWNTRADRARLLTRLFIDSPHPNLLWLVTGIPYARSQHSTPFPISSLVEQRPISETLLEVLRRHNITIGTFCESEKFAHVTYFFNGGHEVTNPHDLYVVVPSPKPHEILSHPQLASRDITAMLLCSLKSNPRDFYVINYANADMLGHTGDFKATIESLEILDQELSKVFNAIVMQRNGTLYVTGDHGNAEFMNHTDDTQIKTGHTTNPVPFLVISPMTYNTSQLLNLTELSDIAPYILQCENLPIPNAMKIKHKS